ncbi:MAG: SPOR domain-containing protein [Acidiferrobacterales bacterium]
MTRERDRAGQYSPKHRIVGAVIVVSLAVIFLPMILSDDQTSDKLGETVSGLNEIPEPTTEVFRMRTASLQERTSGIERAETADKRETLGPQQPEGAGDSSSTPTTAAKATDVKKQNNAKAGAATGSKPADYVERMPQQQSKGWENAQRLRDMLKQSGFLVNLQDVELKGRKAIRVRVGPFQEKDVAIKAQSKIHEQIGVKGVVLAQR